MIGLSLVTVSLPLIGFANHSWMLFAASIPYVLGGIGSPATQSLISNLTPTNEQGQIQGGIASIISLTAIIGPPMMSNLFSYFTDEKSAIYFPGMPFIAGGILAA